MFSSSGRGSSRLSTKHFTRQSYEEETSTLKNELWKTNKDKKMEKKDMNKTEKYRGKKNTLHHRPRELTNQLKSSTEKMLQNRTGGGEGGEGTSLRGDSKRGRG